MSYSHRQGVAFVGLIAEASAGIGFGAWMDSAAAGFWMFFLLQAVGTMVEWACKFVVLWRSET